MSTVCLCFYFSRFILTAHVSNLLTPDEKGMSRSRVYLQETSCLVDKQFGHQIFPNVSAVLALDSWNYCSGFILTHNAFWSNATASEHCRKCS